MYPADTKLHASSIQRILNAMCLAHPYGSPGLMGRNNPTIPCQLCTQIIQNLLGGQKFRAHTSVMQSRVMFGGVIREHLSPTPQEKTKLLLVH